MLTQLEIEEGRIMALRRTEHRLLGPALISLVLLLTYLLKSLLIFLKAGPPEIFQNSFMYILWYYSPTPTASAPISATDAYSWVLLGIIFYYVLTFRCRRNGTNRLGRIRNAVFQEKVKRDLRRRK